MAVYGLVSYDIAESVEKDKNGDIVPRKEKFLVPQALRRLGWVSTTRSEWIGDYSRHDEIMAVLQRNLDKPGDRVFPMVRFDEREEGKVQDWVRLAVGKFFDEVVGRLKETLDKAIQRLDSTGKETLGTNDVRDRMAARIKALDKEVEDMMVSLSTFRLTNEFESFREATRNHMALVQMETEMRLHSRDEEDAKAKA